MNGFTKVPNDFFKWLYDQDLTALDLKILLFVFRKTIGWNKEVDRISLSQFSTALGATNRGLIKAINRLVNAGSLVVYRNSGKITSYKLVNASTWVLVNAGTLTHERKGTKPMNAGSHTKDTTKEYIQKGLKSNKNYKLIGNTYTEVGSVYKEG